MSEQHLAISQLNDFIFCPVSIFFHSLETEENIMVQDSFQLNGTNALNIPTLQHTQPKRVCCRA